jgi:hypothetical protein
MKVFMLPAFRVIVLLQSTCRKFLLNRRRPRRARAGINRADRRFRALADIKENLIDLRAEKTARAPAATAANGYLRIYQDLSALQTWTRKTITRGARVSAQGRRKKICPREFVVGFGMPTIAKFRANGDFGAEKKR